MTDAATDIAAATTATPAPDGNNPQGTQVTTTTGNNDPQRSQISTEGKNAFVLPDEYKDKPWAEKIKSPEDAYKQIENLTALVGKKTIKPIDFETSTPEEIANYHKSLAPEKGVEAYKWSEHSMPEITGPIGEAMVEAGINPYQQKLLAEKFDSIVEKIAGEKASADTSEDGYVAIMKESFGDDYQASVGIVEKALKEFSSDDDKKVFDSVDNKTRAAVDRTTHNLVKFYEERISKILKEHGVVESGAQAEGGNGVNTVKSKAEQRSEIRAEMRALDGKPNSHQKMSELQQKLNKLL